VFVTCIYANGKAVASPSPAECSTPLIPHLGHRHIASHGDLLEALQLAAPALRSTHITPLCAMALFQDGVNSK
jgi:hypothetical protein